ncbi:MAG TPA: hypothetical protein VGJ20_35575, partial [Xanthobacteraceae bacterium]
MKIVNYRQLTVGGFSDNAHATASRSRPKANSWPRERHKPSSLLFTIWILRRGLSPTTAYRNLKQPRA